ncbi:hypothetical protein ACLOJK_034463 [Asimina triloba]
MDHANLKLPTASTIATGMALKMRGSGSEMELLSGIDGCGIGWLQVCNSSWGCVRDGCGPPCCDLTPWLGRCSSVHCCWIEQGIMKDDGLDRALAMGVDGLGDGCWPKWMDADLLFVEMDGARCGGCCFRHQLGLLDSFAVNKNHVGRTTILNSARIFDRMVLEWKKRIASWGRLARSDGLPFSFCCPLNSLITSQMCKSPLVSTLCHLERWLPGLMLLCGSRFGLRRLPDQKMEMACGLLAVPCCDLLAGPMDHANLKLPTASTVAAGMALKMRGSGSEMELLSGIDGCGFGRLQVYNSSWGCVRDGWPTCCDLAPWLGRCSSVHCCWIEQGIVKDGGLDRALAMGVDGLGDGCWPKWTDAAVVFAISWVWRKMLHFGWSKWDADGSGPSANGAWPWTMNGVRGLLSGGERIYWWAWSTLISWVDGCGCRRGQQDGFQPILIGRDGDLLDGRLDRASCWSKKRLMASSMEMGAGQHELLQVGRFAITMTVEMGHRKRRRRRP